MNDLKGTVKNIIDRLTITTNSIFSEKLILEAGEQGIGEASVWQAVQQLQEEKYVEELFNSKVIKRVS